jgi:hypothetical protein
MTRSLAVVLSALALGACDVGSVLVNHGGPDGGGGDSSGVKNDAGGNGCINLVPAANTPDGHHNAGMNCISVGCHLNGNTGTNATAWGFAGTLYDAGGVGVAGATIVITPAGGGTPTTVVTSAAGGAGPGAGNFYVPAGVVPIAGATVAASGCPNVNHMVTALAAGNGGGGCNNCHRPGGQTTPMHLP